MWAFLSPIPDAFPVIRTDNENHEYWANTMKLHKKKYNYHYHFKQEKQMKSERTIYQSWTDFKRLQVYTLYNANR